jgi:hypothetical protein
VLLPTRVRAAKIVEAIKLVVEVYLDFLPALSWSVGLGILCSSTFLQIRRITHVGIQKPMTKEVLKPNEVIFVSDLIF